MAKGYGIILVILAHTAIPDKIFWFIFSFHMPLFFFLSGYLLNLEKYKSWIDFLKSRAKKLIIPYIIFFIILFIYWTLLGHRFGETHDLNVKNWQILYQFTYASTALIMPFGPIWFLLSLFWVEVIFFTLIKIIKQKTLLLISIFGIAAIGYLLSLKLTVRPPWGLDVALIALLFYGLGSFIRQYKTGLSKIASIPIIIALVLIGWEVSHLNMRVSLMENHYGNFYYFIVASLAGIAATVLFARLFHHHFIDWIGKNSLIIFSFHIAVLALIKASTNYFWPHLNIALTGQKNLALGLAFTIIVLVFFWITLNSYPKVKSLILKKSA